MTDTALVHGEEGLRIDPEKLARHIVPVDVIDANPWNPNKMDERTYEAERESIRRFGFIDPCLVRPNPEAPDRWEVIDGEHRWKAAIDEGYSEVLIDSVGPISDLDAKTLTVVLNETRGEADVARLGQLLVEIEKASQGDEWSQPLPYSSAELQHLLSVGRVDWDDFEAAGRNDGQQADPGSDDDAQGHVVTLTLSDEQAEKFRIWTDMLMRETGESVEFVVVDSLKHAAEKL